MKIVIETKSVWLWTRRVLALLLTWVIIATVCVGIERLTGHNMDFYSGFWSGVSLCFYVFIWSE